MADEHAEIVETIAEITEEKVEEANRRAEEAEATNRALIDASLEDRREQRLNGMEERLGSWENRLNETTTWMSTKMEEMTAHQAEMLETLKTLSTSTPLNQPPIQAEIIEEKPEGQEGVPVKTELQPVAAETTITEIPTEPKPETKGVPGKRKIRLL